MERIGIVLGAGASFGAGAIWPSPPPLGTDLYGALVTAYPHSWGQLPSNMDKLFAGSFEAGMDALWNDAMSSALLVDMTRFFLQFEPPSDHSDNYTRLVKALIARKLIDRCAFATLNYECVLDLVAASLGLKLTYLADAPPPGNLLVYKPHGACNLLPQAEMYNLSLVVPGGNAGYFGGPLRPMSPWEAKAKYDAGFALPAAMSLYAPGKHTPVAREFVDETRRLWNSWVESCATIIAIGVRPLVSDAHIWDSIIGSKCAVWFVGGQSAEYRDLDAAIDGRLRYFGETFGGAIDGLVAALPSGDHLK